MSISNILQLASTLVALSGLLFVAYQVKQARDEIRRGDLQRRDEAERLRRQATLEYARQTLDTRYQVWPELPDDFDVEAVSRFVRKCIIGNSRANLEAAFGYLGLLETFCIEIDHEIYDIDTADKLYGPRVCAVAKNYWSLIEWRRNETSTYTFYDGLEKVAQDFAVRRSIILRANNVAAEN
jgi:hypothetical protein